MMDHLFAVPPWAHLKHALLFQAFGDMKKMPKKNISHDSNNNSDSEVTKNTP